MMNTTCRIFPRAVAPREEARPPAGARPRTAITAANVHAAVARFRMASSDIRCLRWGFLLEGVTPAWPGSRSAAFGDMAALSEPEIGQTRMRPLPLDQDLRVHDVPELPQLLQNGLERLDRLLHHR